MIHTLALIGALGVTLSLAYFYKCEFPISPIPAALRDSLAWGDREFLISLSMAVTGIVAVVLWDALFPDRRDCLTLSILPLRGRTIFAAKLASVLLLFGAVTGALNAPHGAFPWVVLGDHASLATFARHVAAHAAALVAACAFVFFSMLGLEGLLVSSLNFRQYKWISTWVQLAALLTILSVVFFTPNLGHPSRLADPRHHFAVQALPSFWFLGLYELLLGNRLPIVRELAGMAKLAVAGSTLLALVSYALAYRRYMQDDRGGGCASWRGACGPAVGGAAARSPARDEAGRTGGLLFRAANHGA